jgi:hypothetical protein
MTFQVVHQHADSGRSPFQVVDSQSGREVEWIDRFLDRVWVHRLSEAILRNYALNLLHFLRWWASRPYNHLAIIASRNGQFPIRAEGYTRHVVITHGRSLPTAGHVPPGDPEVKGNGTSPVCAQCKTDLARDSVSQRKHLWFCVYVPDKQVSAFVPGDSQLSVEAQSHPGNAAVLGIPRSEPPSE